MSRNKTAQGVISGSEGRDYCSVICLAGITDDGGSQLFRIDGKQAIHIVDRIIIRGQSARGNGIVPHVGRTIGAATIVVQRSSEHAD